MTDLTEHTDQIKKPPGIMMRGRKAHGIIESTEVTDLTDHTDVTVSFILIIYYRINCSD